MIDKATLVLHHYPVMRELSGDTLDALMASATFMAVPADAMMFDKNPPCMGFALLLSGGARVVKAVPNSRELHLYDVLPGETCILSRRQRKRPRSAATSSGSRATSPIGTTHINRYGDYTLDLSRPVEPIDYKIKF